MEETVRLMEAVWYWLTSTLLRHFWYNDTMTATPHDLLPYDMIVVTGDRKWSDYDIICDIWKGASSDVIFILGDAKGADALAAKACFAFDRMCIVEYADWRIGGAAGPARNGRMLEHTQNAHNPIVLAFHHALNHSKGTRNCVSQALDRGLPVINIVEELNWQWCVGQEKLKGQKRPTILFESMV